MLADGVYDGIVVDGEAATGGGRLEVVILAGAHKGEVVAVRTTELPGDPIDLLGDPVTLTVSEGRPQLTFDL